MKKITFLLLVLPLFLVAQTEKESRKIDTLPDGRVALFRTITLAEPIPDTAYFDRIIAGIDREMDTLRARRREWVKQRADAVKLLNRRNKKNNAPPRNGRDVEAPAAVEPPKQSLPKPPKKGKG
jgi:hypothetical protein